jgi:AbrB family looped-hinge helix DNA binding protein
MAVHRVHRGQVTIPAHIRKELGLKDGDPVWMEVTEDGNVLLRPHDERDADQWWFWTPEWQAKEREVDEDIAAGRSTTFMSDEEFLAWLTGCVDTPSTDS